MPRVSSRHVRQVRRVVEFGWDGQHWTTIYIYSHKQEEGAFVLLKLRQLFMAQTIVGML